MWKDWWLLVFEGFPKRQTDFELTRRPKLKETRRSMEVNSLLKGSRDLQKDNQSLTCSAITASPSLEQLVQKEDLSTLVVMHPGKLNLPKFRCVY